MNVQMVAAEKLAQCPTVSYIKYFLINFLKNKIIFYKGSF